MKYSSQALYKDIRSNLVVKRMSCQFKVAPQSRLVVVCLKAQSAYDLILHTLKTAQYFEQRTVLFSELAVCGNLVPLIADIYIVYVFPQAFQ